MQPQIRTVSLPLDESKYVNAGELLDAITEFDGESRVWRAVQVRAVGGDARIALMAAKIEPSSDAASITIAETDEKALDLFDFDKAYIKGGEAVESGSEEQFLEIIGTPEG